MRKTALLCQKLTHGSIEGASKLMFILISILRPISNFLALFKLCDYNLILLTNVKLFEKHLSAHKTRCRWPDDRFWGLHDYITQRHTLTLLRHQSDSLLQRQRFVQKLLRETLWLDRQNCFSWCSQTVPTQTHSPPNVSFVEAAFKRSDVFWKCEKYTEVQWTLTR